MTFLPCRIGESEDGFTIIETLVAMMIIAVAFLGLAGVHIVSSQAQSLGNNQGLATFLADEQMEQMRRTSYADIETAVLFEQREGVPFTVVRMVNDLGTSKKVGVLVLWNGRLGVRSLLFSSLVSRVTNP